MSEVVRVAINLASGEQPTLTPDMAITDRSGHPVKLAAVADVLACEGAFIDYPTVSRWTPPEGEEWRGANEKWLVSTGRIFGAMVCDILTVTDEEADDV